MGVIIFNGVSSDKYDIIVEHLPNCTLPTKKYNVVDIPGKDGSYILNEGTFSNVRREYEIACVAKNKSFYDMAGGVGEWLYSPSGYCTLEDSYDPNHFCYAYVSDETDLENLFNKVARGTIVFECLPQRYLKSGFKATTYNLAPTDTAYVYNPYRFPARPLMRVKGSINAGVSQALMYIGDSVILFKKIDSNTDAQSFDFTIDCEKRDVANNNNNNKVFVDSSKNTVFPSLQNGETKITCTTSITIEFTPRWWTI